MILAAQLLNDVALAVGRPDTEMEMRAKDALDLLELLFRQQLRRLLFVGHLQSFPLNPVKHPLCFTAIIPNHLDTYVFSGANTLCGTAIPSTSLGTGLAVVPRASRGTAIPSTSLGTGLAVVARASSPCPGQ
jgi:hypothetical protein